MIVISTIFKLTVISTFDNKTFSRNLYYISICTRTNNRYILPISTLKEELHLKLRLSMSQNYQHCPETFKGNLKQKAEKLENNIKIQVSQMVLFLSKRVKYF